MKKKKTKISVLMIAIVVGFFWSSAFAQEASSETKNWEFNLAPFYLWGVSLEGEQTLGTKTIDVEVDFDDIFDKLEAAFIVNFQGMYKNKWGFIVDYNYLNISDDDTNAAGIKKDANLKLNLVEVDGLYRWKYLKHFFDLKFGLRGLSMDTDVQVGPLKADQKKEWVDPIIGLRWGWGFAERWTLKMTGDIGGFGVGSDLTWQGAGIIDWQPFKYVSFIGGYRAIYVDYESGSGSNLFKFDATMHGPLIGVNFRW
jgi:hypothetical protein